MRHAAKWVHQRAAASWLAASPRTAAERYACQPPRANLVQSQEMAPEWQRGTWLRCDNAPRMLPRAAGITHWYDVCMRSGRCASAAVLASAGALLDVRVCLVLSGFVLCDAVVQRRRRATSLRPPLKQRVLMAVSLVKAHPWRQFGGHTVRFLSGVLLFQTLSESCGRARGLSVAWNASASLAARCITLSVVVVLQG